MPKNKKKFIPKKNAVVFQLVHRSQQDPLTLDENAPQHVLKEYKSKKNKEEERKYGIFFDDEYDYMQHLKSINDPVNDWEQVNYKFDDRKSVKKPNESKVQLPSSVFQSHVEESVGLLNKAAPIYGPRPELDPDIVAALDDDFDFDNPDNILEDNFVELANEAGEECSDEDEDKYNSDLDSSECGMSLIETKSRFTDYSMTSSVIRRNKQLTFLDDHFEKVFEKYAESDIGSLPCEDIEGIGNMQDKLIEYVEELKTIENKDDELKSRILKAAIEQECVEEETDALVLDSKETWDCQSILSTYSNLYNHPAKIYEKKDSNKINVDKKTGVPVDELRGPRLTSEALSKLPGNHCENECKSIVSYISELSIRPKNETPEEKKIRKQNIREFRRDRRKEKKANKLAFKDEKSRQEKILLNVKHNQTRVKMF